MGKAKNGPDRRLLLGLLKYYTLSSLSLPSWATPGERKLLASDHGHKLKGGIANPEQ